MDPVARPKPVGFTPETAPLREIDRRRYERLTTEPGFITFLLVKARPDPTMA